MAYCVDASPAVGEHNEVHAEQKNPLGAVRLFSDGNHYIYLKGVSSLVANEWVTFVPGTWTAVRMVTGNKGGAGVAIAQAAVDAATEYGWFGYIGSFTAVCESSIVSNAYLYVLSAGRADDAIVKNEQIKNARTTTAGAGGGTATVAIDRPFLGSNDESA